MRIREALAGVLASILSVSGPALAADRWEKGTFTDDDSSATYNTLRHGLRQANHDLEYLGIPDRDWYRVEVQRNHSYEVRASSGTVMWDAPAGSNEAYLDRVDSSSNVLTPGAPSEDDPVGGSTGYTGTTVRWIAPADATEFVRVYGDISYGASDNYDIEMFDTTYSVPRWNNSATQITVILIRNSSRSSVDGSILFYSAVGTLIHNKPFTIPGNGLLNLNTATIGALAGQGGSAAIANLGRYGVLSGKAVALEVSTGFTFDTQIEPFPR